MARGRYLSREEDEEEEEEEPGFGTEKEEDITNDGAVDSASGPWWDVGDTSLNADIVVRWMESDT